jgi:hypothetical protein
MLCVTLFHHILMISRQPGPGTQGRSDWKSRTFISMLRFERFDQISSTVYQLYMVRLFE